MKNETQSGAGAFLWTGDFTLLFFSNFFMYLGAATVIPVLPVYLAQVGGNDLQIGFIMGCYTIAAILIRLFAVKITGYMGSRLFLFSGLFICGMAATGYYLTTIISLLFLFRVLHGFGFGTTTTLYSAMVSNIIPKARMGEGMGYFGLGTVIATATGPSLGAVIVLMPHYHWVFLMSTGLILVSIMLTKFGRTGCGHEGMEKGAVTKFSFSDFFEIKALFPSALVFFLGFAMSGYFTFMVLFGKEAGIEKGVGAFFLIISVAEFLIRTVSGKLYDRKGPFIVLVPGSLACLAGTIILSLSGNIPILVVSSILIGIGLGMTFPVLQAWSLRIVGPKRRVAATATFFNFMDGGMASGAMILGIIAEASSYSLMYLYSSLSFIILLGIYLIYYMRTRHRQ